MKKGGSRSRSEREMSGIHVFFDHLWRALLIALVAGLVFKFFIIKLIAMNR